MRFWHYSLPLLLCAPLAGVLVARFRRPSVFDYMQQATAAQKAGRIAEAEKALRHLLARDSDNGVARMRLAELAMDREEFGTAAAAVDPIPDTDPLALRARLIEADAWFRLNRLAFAESCWLRARQIDPKHPSSWYWLIHLYGVQLRQSLWRQNLWEVYDRGQAGLEEMVQIMLAGLELKNLGTNIPRLRSAVAADPADHDTRRALGLHLLRAGQLQESRRELTSLHDERPDDGEAALALAECLVACGDRDALEPLLAKCPAEARDDWRYYHAQACLAILQARPDRAIEQVRQALHVAPYAAALHVKMAEAVRLTGDNQSLQGHLAMTRETAKIEQIAPMLHTNGWDLDLIRQIVSSCEKLLLIEEARGWVQVGLAKAPDDASLLEARARLARLPVTSSRKPPTWESIQQSVSF